MGHDCPRREGSGSGPWPRFAPSSVCRCRPRRMVTAACRPATAPPPPPWRPPRRIPSPRTGATSTAGSGMGAWLPSSGIGATLGTPLLAAVELAVREINGAGGINGELLDVAIADEGSDPATAYQALTELLEQDQVDVIVGPASSRVALGALDVLAEARVVTCSPTSAAYDLSERRRRRLLRPHHRLRGAGGGRAHEGDDRVGDDTLLRALPGGRLRLRLRRPGRSGSSAGSGRRSAWSLTTRLRSSSTAGSSWRWLVKSKPSAVVGPGAVGARVLAGAGPP